MKYIFLLLLSFCFVTTHIQAMSWSIDNNERPYGLTAKDQQKLKTIILDEYYNNIQATPESRSAIPQRALLTSYDLYFELLDKQETVAAAINTNTHAITVTIQISSRYPNCPAYKIVNIVTKSFSMKEFCDITDTQISNAGSLYR